MSKITYTFDPGGRPLDELRDEVREAVEAEVFPEVRDENLDRDDQPHLFEFGDAVVWNQFGYFRELPPPDGVRCPQVVVTRWEDLYYSAWGTLYRREDGAFVAVDEFRGPSYGYSRTQDYFLVNYGIAPKVDYRGSTMDPGPLPGEFEHPGRPAPDTPPPADPGDRGGSGDGGGPGGDTLRDRRERALADLRPEGFDDDPGADRYERFLSALGEADERTQRLVAPELWDPAVLPDDGQVPAPSLVGAFAELLGASAPELRAGALVGAARVLGELLVPVKFDVDASRPDPDGLESAARSFFEAVRAGLADDDPLVNRRAGGLLTAEPIGGETERWTFARDDAAWYAVDFELRWEVARLAAATAVEDPEVGGGHLADDDGGALPFETTVDRDADRPAEVVPAFVAHGWRDRGPQYPAVRSALADLVADGFVEDPATVAEYADEILGAIADGDATVGDLELARELAFEVPDAVADVAPEMEALLDDDRRSRGAAGALGRLRKVRPEAVSVDPSRLLAVTGDVRDENGSLDPDRLAALAEVDPGAAGDVLREAATDVDATDGWHPGYVSEAVYRVARTDPAVVADALPAVVEAFEATSIDRQRDRIATGIALAATAHPERAGDAAPGLAAVLDADAELSRAALATALVAVGETDPGSLPAALDPLLEAADRAPTAERVDRARRRADVALPEDWPPELPSGDEV